MATIKRIRAGDGSTELQIVFVHGLEGHHQHTWMHDKQKLSTLWPEWVSRDCRIDVWSVDYDAKLSGWTGNGMPLPLQGDALLDCLHSEPELNGKPLILIGHSLGGLVIKTAISQGMNNGVDRFEELVKTIRGVVFIATPHTGAHLANVATAISSLLRTNNQVGDLKKHNAHLLNLHRQFLACCRRQSFLARTYVETEGVLIGKRVLGINFGKRILVVDTASSEPNIPGENATSLPENHFSICKPNSKNSQIHKSLVSFIKEAIEVCGQNGPHSSNERAAQGSGGHNGILNSLSDTPEILSAAKQVLNASDFPRSMALSDRLVPNPTWDPGAIPMQDRPIVTDRLTGQMFLAVCQPAGQRPHLLCYWSPNWGAYFLPFYKPDSNPVGTTELPRALSEHVKKTYGGIAHSQDKFFVSIKKNEELKNECWLYAFEFYNLILPKDYQLPENYKWMTFDRLTDPEFPEAKLNGDVLKAIRSYFSKGMHNLERSDALLIEGSCDYS